LYYFINYSVNGNKFELKSQEKQSASSTFLRKLTTFNLVLNSNPKLVPQRMTIRKNTAGTQIHLDENWIIPKIEIHENVETQSKEIIGKNMSSN